MFIAFEGPDNVGKSTSAARLSSSGRSVYQVTKNIHTALQNTEAEANDPPSVVTYDRIDWFSHMVYRLALPDREWNDERPRTVFAMPDTHLVVKIHRSDLADFTADEVVDTPIAGVNEMYYYQADFLMNLNRARDYSLFKSVSIVEVCNEVAAGTYDQRLAAHDSHAFGYDNPLTIVRNRLVDSDETLLEFLRSAEQHSV